MAAVIRIEGTKDSDCPEYGGRGHRCSASIVEGRYDSDSEMEDDDDYQQTPRSRSETLDDENLGA